jgi:hypothetical protein
MSIILLINNVSLKQNIPYLFEHFFWNKVSQKLFFLEVPQAFLFVNGIPQRYKRLANIVVKFVNPPIKKGLSQIVKK